MDLWVICLLTFLVGVVVGCNFSRWAAPPDCRLGRIRVVYAVDNSLGLKGWIAQRFQRHWLLGARWVRVTPYLIKEETCNKQAKVLEASEALEEVSRYET